MENSKFKNSAEFENAKSILGMCYDRLSQIAENMFLVTLEGKQTLIDVDNKILMDFQGSRSTKVRQIGGLMFVGDDWSSRLLNLNTLKLGNTHMSNIVECGEAAIVQLLGEGYGIIGSSGGFIMPPIYQNIIVQKVKHASISVWAKYKENSFISEVSADGLSVTKFDDKVTPDNITRLISTKFKTIGGGGRASYKLLYEVARNYDMVTNNEFDDLMFMKAYAPFGLIHTWKNEYAGLVRTNGKIVVPNTRFKSVDSLGYQGICIVGEKTVQNGLLLGIYKEDKGLIVNCVFEEKVNLQNIPITYLWRDINGTKDWWILGNDGYVKKELVEAFPISRLNIAGIDACKINVYGHEYIVDSKMAVLKDINYESTHWVPMN